MKYNNLDSEEIDLLYRRKKNISLFKLCLLIFLMFNAALIGWGIASIESHEIILGKSILFISIPAFVFAIYFFFKRC